MFLDIDLRTCMMTVFVVKSEAKFSSRAEERERMESPAGGWGRIPQQASPLTPCDSKGPAAVSVETDCPAWDVFPSAACGHSHLSAHGER